MALRGVPLALRSSSPHASEESKASLGPRLNRRATKASSPQKSEIFGDPGKKTSLHESTTIAPHYLHDSCVARV